MAMHKGIRIHQYLDNWLVRAITHHICLQHTQELVEICQKLGWMVNFEKSELDPKQVFDFFRLPVQSEMWPGPTDTGLVAEPSKKTVTSILTGLSGLAVHVIDKSANSHRKASSSQSTTYSGISKTTGGYWNY